MSEFPVNATIFNTDPSWTAAQAVAEFNKWLTATKQLPGAQTPDALTIATGAITPARSMVIVDTEAAAASDDLTTILISTMHDGAMVMLIAANAGRVVNVVHGVGAGGIELLGGADRALSTSAWLMVRRSGSRWVECVCCSAVPTGPLGDESVAPASTAFVAQEIMDAEINHYPGYNYIINGDFDFWLRADSQISSGYGSDDRFVNASIGSTKTHSKQLFSIGGLFPDGEPYTENYSRTVVTSVAGAGNCVYKLQRIESVRTLAGKKCVLRFYAKADAVKNITVEIIQSFGTGGSPSASILGISVQKVSLTTAWQKFTLVLDIPSISGKTLGTDKNDSLNVLFWFDAGSDFNARSDSLGNQSGTFDIACVSLVKGDVDVKPIPRSYGEELALCQRYYEGGYVTSIFNNTSGTANCGVGTSFKVTKRVIPVVTVSDSMVAIIITRVGFDCYKVLTLDNWMRGTFTSDAEL